MNRTDLVGANLSGAELRGANINETILIDTVLTRVTMGGAEYAPNSRCELPSIGECTKN